MTDHNKNALRLIEGLHACQAKGGITGPSMLAVAIEAQVEVTMNLAEQQRTANELARIANLIALAESGRTTVNGARQALAALYSGSAEEGSAHMALLPEIREALGL